MGGSGKWVKALIGLKKPPKDHHEKEGSRSKKWKLWRSSSGDLGSTWKRFRRNHHRAAASEGSDSSSSVADAFTAAVATVVRAPPKDFRVVREEWAAIRIQTAFRGFLARRALGALKGVVRIQALVRGWLVRKQAAVTLRCMQALVRVQARVRARRVRMSIEGQAVQHMLNERRSKADLLKQAEEGWCDSTGTLEEIKAKQQMRQEGVFKRERALAYFLAQKQWKSDQNSDSRTKNPILSLKSHVSGKNSWGWTWLERWMEAKPRDNRLIEKVHTDSSEKTPPSRNCVDLKKVQNVSSERTPSKVHVDLEPCSVKVRRNNMTARISAKPPLIGQVTQSSSSPSSEFRYDESSGSSSLCTSTTTPVSSNTVVASDRTVESNKSRPTYMNVTESTKAKQKNLSHRIQMQSMDEFQFLKKSAAFCNGDSKISASCDLSVGISKQLYPPGKMEKNLVK